MHLKNVLKISYKYSYMVIVLFGCRSHLDCIVLELRVRTWFRSFVCIVQLLLLLFLWFTCCLLVWLLLRIFLFLLLLLLVILLFCFLTLFRMGAVKLGTVIPYLRKIQKLYKSRDTSLEFCWHQHFSPETSKFCYIKKYTYRLEFDR